MTIKDIEIRFPVLDISNVNDFVEALRIAKNDSSVPDLNLLSYLDRVLDGFRAEGRRICLAAPDITPSDRNALLAYGKAAAAAILVAHSIHSVSAMRRDTLLFLEYASALVSSRYDFVGNALDAICYPMTETGLDWKSVQDAPSLDLITYKLTAGIQFDRTRPDVFRYTGKGKVICSNGTLSIFSSEVGETGSKAFDLFDGRVEAISRNSRDEKLKSSDQENIEAIAAFADTFLRSQESFVKGKTKHRTYSHGDTVNIKLLDIEGEHVNCVLLDHDNPIYGPLVNEELIRRTVTQDIFPYFCQDDVIAGAVLVEDENGVGFSIKDAYASYAKEAAQKSERDGSVFEAKVTRVCTDIGRICWMTPFGYGGISLPVEGKDLKEGDICVMSIHSIQASGQSFYINLCPPRYSYDVVEVRFEEDDVLQDFVKTEDEVEMLWKTAAEVEKTGDATTVGTLASIIANRAPAESSLNRYKSLLIAIFLRATIGESEGTSRARAEAFYRRALISFAQGVKISADSSLVLGEDRADLLHLLSVADSKRGTLLAKAFDSGADVLTRKVGALLLGMELSAEFPDQLKADREEIRRKICELLEVSDQYRPMSESKVGKYGRVENHDVEFKASYVFRNDEIGKADLDYQGRGQVFEAVCGFLNADGGTVYLGVNNNGDPFLSEDAGIRADMKWLCSNYQTVNSMRFRKLGHNVVKVDEEDLDHYVLFLNGEKELFFRESLQGNITIEATEDGDAVRIRVRPSEYEIAYLYSDRERNDGVAYVRDGGRTVRMTAVQKERRLAGLKKVTKEIGFVVTIQEAIDQHRKLIFKDYASGNSGKVEDRFVVPVNLFYNDENVYCYDLDSRRYKQFRLKRISSIETEMDDPCYTLPLEAPKEVDVFRWLADGRPSFHIKLRMDIGAKNYLLEEYSCAESLPESELYEESRGKWILDTRVNGLGAVRRFYLGLADKIEILDTEDSDALRKECSQYVKDNIIGTIERF